MEEDNVDKEEVDEKLEEKIEKEPVDPATLAKQHSHAEDVYLALFPCRSNKSSGEVEIEQIEIHRVRFLDAEKIPEKKVDEQPDKEPIIPEEDPEQEIEEETGEPIDKSEDKVPEEDDETDEKDDETDEKDAEKTDKKLTTNPYPYRLRRDGLTGYAPEMGNADRKRYERELIESALFDDSIIDALNAEKKSANFLIAYRHALEMRRTEFYFGHKFYQIIDGNKPIVRDGVYDQTGAKRITIDVGKVRYSLVDFGDFNIYDPYQKKVRKSKDFGPTMSRILRYHISKAHIQTIFGEHLEGTHQLLQIEPYIGGKRSMHWYRCIIAEVEKIDENLYVTSKSTRDVILESSMLGLIMNSILPNKNDLMRYAEYKSFGESETTTQILARELDTIMILDL